MQHQLNGADLWRAFRVLSTTEQQLVAKLRTPWDSMACGDALVTSSGKKDPHSPKVGLKCPLWDGQLSASGISGISRR